MSDEDSIGGPLGELLAELPSTPGDAPREAVHTRVLPVAAAEGAELVFSCWRDPGGAWALHEALKLRIEGSLLGELSRGAVDLREEASALTGLRLFVFADIPDVDAAVAAFGFSKTGGRDPQTRASIARVRHEASAFGEAIPEEPTAVYAARTAQAEIATRVEEELVEVTEDVWGRNPGAPFARLRRAVAAAGGPTLTADVAGVDAAERALFVEAPSALRWIGPLTFQALCDLIAVAIDRELGRRVDWAETTADSEGIAPPPMIRIDGQIHVPLALEVLRWCVMPRKSDEEVPPLCRWVRESFGAG